MAHTLDDVPIFTVNRRGEPCHRNAGWIALAEKHDAAGLSSGRQADNFSLNKIAEIRRVLDRHAICSIWCQRTGSTVSFNPTALVTATSVERRGLPFAESAR
jgi:hypothetical protein